MKNIIRYSLLCMIIFSTSEAIAYSRLTHCFYDIEKCYVVGFSSSEIEKTPKWEKTKSNPPVSVRRAVELAEVRKNQLVKDHPGLKWKLVSCELMPDDERWYWLIRYQAVSSDKFPRGDWPEFGVIVLMDGTVPKHDVQEDDLKSLEDFVKRKIVHPPKTIFDFECYGDGGFLKYHFSLNEMRKTPRWKKDAQNPPLSARKAIQLAEKRKNEFVKDDAKWVWNLDSVVIVPVEKNRWYWLVTYIAQLKGGSSSGIPFHFSVVVLMDGTIPKHQKKQP